MTVLTGIFFASLTAAVNPVVPFYCLSSLLDSLYSTFPFPLIDPRVSV